MEDDYTQAKEETTGEWQEEKGDTREREGRPVGTLGGRVEGGLNWARLAAPGDSAAGTTGMTTTSY